MAPVTRWAALALGGCAAIALAYVPPRGASGREGPRIFAMQLAERTPARRRAQALAEQWRATNGALRILQDRREMRQIMAAKPIVVLRGAPVSADAARHVESVLDTIWGRLGLSETKIRVAVIIELAASGAASNQPSPDADRTTYLTPDSTDRTTCIVSLPASPYWTRVITGSQSAIPSRFSEWLQAGLGPCAFHAAYGTPGRSVRRWLAARSWDVGLLLDLEPPSPEQFSSARWMGDQRSPWFWDALYSYPPPTVACLAGRSSGCRAAVLAGADDRGPIPIPHVMRIERRWWRAQALLPGERYLADVAREVGRERFQRFWTSPLPVDTALAAALKQPVGEWTEQWERRFFAPVRLGAAAPLGATALAVLLAGIVVSAVALAASRRQVR